MIIHHYRPFTRNVGDYFVRDGIHQRLRQRFPSARIIELPANDPLNMAAEPVGLLGPNLSRSNAEADLVVVGGSNLYEGPEWRFVTNVTSLAALRPPIVFVGLGVGSIRGGHSVPLSEKSIAEIKASHRRALGVAVRDYETVQFLKQLGIESEMTACPATFVGSVSMKTNQVRRVVVSGPPLRFLPRWGHRGWLRSSLMIGTFKRLLESLVAQDLHIDVVAQDARDVDYLTRILEPFQRVPLYFGNEPTPYYELFQSADFAVCYRLHMAISCVGWGVPFCLVNFDLRTAAFRDTYQLQTITYDAFDWASSRRLLRDVRSLASYRSQHATLYKTIESRRDVFRIRTERFYDDIARLLARQM